MSHEIIQGWLKLPAGSWPPDHYTLLGLPPGEQDVARIERHVQERLDIVRRHQLVHPEQATEAMNHLARAFMCLTDSVTKQAYDTRLLGLSPAAVREPAPVAVAVSDEQEAPLQLLGPVEDAPPEPAPPPVEPPPPEPAPPPVEPPPPEAIPLPPVATPAPPVAIPLLPAEAAVPIEERADPIQQAAERSPAAQRGLGTRRALYRRLAHTRQLARAWEVAGKYLAWPKRQLTKPAEATELLTLLTAIRNQLPGFPAILGEAGQPGYLVVALARQQGVVPTFQALLGTQRAALARDWWAGRALLSKHREFLRKELRTLRKKNVVARLGRAVVRFVTDQPGYVLLFLGLLALNVAIWRQYWASDWSLSRAPASAPASAPGR
jgi:hypothetical protein